MHIQREMAGRGKIIKFHIPVAGRFEFPLNPAELLVLSHVKRVAF